MTPCRRIRDPEKKADFVCDCQPAECANHRRVVIGSRWRPGHVVRIDTESGAFEEVNGPCDRDDESRVQRALLAPKKPGEVDWGVMFLQLFEALR